MAKKTTISIAKSPKQSKPNSERKAPSTTTRSSRNGSIKKPLRQLHWKGRKRRRREGPPRELSVVPVARQCQHLHQGQKLRQCPLCHPKHRLLYNISRIHHLEAAPQHGRYHRRCRRRQQCRVIKRHRVGHRRRLRRDHRLLSVVAAAAAATLTISWGSHRSERAVP